MGEKREGVEADDASAAVENSRGRGGSEERRWSSREERAMGRAQQGFRGEGIWLKEGGGESNKIKGIRERKGGRGGGEGGKAREEEEEG